ncbi:MAG: nucleotide-binding protein [Anditalea sp.]
METKTIFIGSSGEGIKVAEAIQILLSIDGFDTIVWNQGVFGLGRSILEELVTILHKSDFGIFILRGDDLLTSRGQNFNATRDNVLFELGLFIGHQGRFNTFIIHDNSVNTKIISDLSGIIYTSYDGSKSNLNMSLGPAVARIKQQIYNQLQPKEILYTEWHLGTKKYIERLLLSKNASEKIVGTRLYEEVGGKTQIFNVQGFQGRGFYWMEYHREDGIGGGTIMLHDIGTGNFNGLITAGHCDTSALRCYKNRWVLLSDEKDIISYNPSWLEKIGLFT